MKKQLFIIGSAIALGSISTSLKAQTASLQVIHNCADAAATTVDIYAGSTLLINDLQFRNASQTFTNIPAGVPIVVGIAPGTSTSSAQAIATFTVNFTSGSSNIVVADGIVSASGYNPGNTTAGFTLNSYTTALSAAPNGTTTSVLVHHGSTDAPTVDIVAPFTGTNPFLPNILVNNASYGAFAGYLNLPTTNYKIQVRDQYSENVVAEYSAPLQTLNLGGAALTVVASGFLNPANNSNGPAFGLYVALPTGGALIALPSSTISSTRLQAIHNCADLAATQVDVYVQSATSGPNAIKLIDDFTFRTASPFIDVPAGETISLSIAAPTSTSVVGALATFTYNLSSASKYQIIATGLVSGAGYTPNSTVTPYNIEVYASARERSTNVINTDVLVYHGATDAPTVDVQAQGAGTIVNDLAYGTFNTTGYLGLPSNTSAGDYILYVTDATGTSTVVSYSAPLNTLNLAGNAITVLASGFLNPATNSNGPAFGLWVSLPSGGNLIPLPIYTATSIKENNSLSSFISVYPNPFSDNITVKNNTNELVEVSIVDLLGKTILVNNSNLNNIVVNTNEIPQGIYFINVKTAKEKASFKIVK